MEDYHDKNKSPIRGWNRCFPDRHDPYYAPEHEAEAKAYADDIIMRTYAFAYECEALC